MVLVFLIFFTIINLVEIDFILPRVRFHRISDLTAKGDFIATAQRTIATLI
ncbi:MAG: hypothetical protein ACI4MQ_03655 [Candidatus Coproplasma sp.]